MSKNICFSPCTVNITCAEREWRGAGGGGGYLISDEVARPWQCRDTDLPPLIAYHADKGLAELFANTCGLELSAIEIKFTNSTYLMDFLTLMYLIMNAEADVFMYKYYIHL